MYGAAESAEALAHLIEVAELIDLPADAVLRATTELATWRAAAADHDGPATLCLLAATETLAAALERHLERRLALANVATDQAEPGRHPRRRSADGVALPNLPCTAT